MSGWILLQSIPHEGTTLVLEADPLWESLLAEFSIPCRIIDPLRAEVFILPQEDGVLMRGSFTGKVALPCDRCAEEGVIALSQRFDAFEPFPEEEPRQQGTRHAPRKDAEQDEAVIRTHPQGKGVEINPAALVWEEFSLALPVKPLCGADCKGLCPICGCNKNVKDCACARNTDDERFAVLRTLKPAKQ